MSAPVQVLITVDSEWWPRADDWDGSDWRRHFRRDMLGETPEGQYGLGYQMDVLDAHRLKGVFLIESLFACMFGVEPLAEVVAMVQGRGHEVQLHAHTEWLRWMPEPVVPPRPGRNVKDYPEDEQYQLLSRALDNLRAAGASNVCAFRAGNYGADAATLRALARLGLCYDTSYNESYLNSDCGLHLPEHLLQPAMVEGVCEIPISDFADYPGHHRLAQVCACSFREMRRALVQAARGGWHTFVIVSHSFDLMRRDGAGVPVGPDRIVVKRFEQLCRFLAENPERFRTVGFSDLDHEAILTPVAAHRLRSNVVLTAGRYAEQFARRFRP